MTSLGFLALRTLSLLVLATTCFEIALAADPNWGKHQNLTSNTYLTQSGLPAHRRIIASRPIFNSTRWLVTAASSAYSNPVSYVATLDATSNPTLTVAQASQTQSPLLNGSAVTFTYTDFQVLPGSASSVSSAHFLYFGGVDSAGNKNGNMIDMRVSRTSSEFGTSTYPDWPILVTGLDRAIATTDSRINGTSSSNPAYIFGGIAQIGTYSSGVYTSTCILLDCWTTSLSLIPQPNARITSHGVDYNGYWYIFGGENGVSVFGDMWAFSFDLLNWTDLSYTSDANYKFPPARKNHALALLQGNAFGLGPCMLMVGGIGSNGAVLDDIWIFDFVTRKWEQIQSVGGNIPSFVGRSGAGLLAHPYLPKAYLYGGLDNSSTTQTQLWELDFSGVSAPIESPVQMPEASPNVEIPVASPQDPPQVPPSDPPVIPPVDEPQSEPILPPMDAPTADPIEPPFSPPVAAVACHGSAPSAEFTCANGAWVSTTSITVDTIVIPASIGDVVITNGSLIVSGDLTFSGLGSSIIVQNGCAGVGRVVVNLSPEETEQLEKDGKRTVTLVQQSASCPSSLDTVPVKGNAATLSSCKKFVAQTAKSNSSPTQLSAVLYIDTSNCKTRWIIAGASVGGAFLIVGVAIAGLCANKKVRTRFFPSWSAAQENVHAAYQTPDQSGMPPSGKTSV